MENSEDTLEWEGEVEEKEKKERSTSDTSNSEKQDIRKWFNAKKRKHTNKILVKRLSNQARVPTKKSQEAAGYDLIAPVPVYVPPTSSRIIGTKIALQIPKGYYGRIAGRSGLAKDFQLTILGGVIDSDYRGEIKVLLFNLGAYPVDLPEHSRIAQIIIAKNSRRSRNGGDNRIRSY